MNLKFLIGLLFFLNIINSFSNEEDLTIQVIFIQDEVLSQIPENYEVYSLIYFNSEIVYFDKCFNNFCTLPFIKNSKKYILLTDIDENQIQKHLQNQPHNLDLLGKYVQVSHFRPGKASAVFIERDDKGELVIVRRDGQEISLNFDFLYSLQFFAGLLVFISVFLFVFFSLKPYEEEETVL